MDDDTLIRLPKGIKSKSIKDMLQSLQYRTPEDTPYALRYNKARKRPLSNTFSEYMKQDTFSSKKRASFANKTYANISSRSLDSTMESEQTLSEVPKIKKKLRKSTRMSKVPAINMSLQEKKKIRQITKEVSSPLSDANSDSFNKDMKQYTPPSDKRGSFANKTYANLSARSPDSTSDSDNSATITPIQRRRLRKSTRMSMAPDIDVPLHRAKRQKSTHSMHTSALKSDANNNSYKKEKENATLTSKKVELTANESYDISGRSLDLTRESDKSHREATEKKTKLRKSTRMSMVPDIGISLYHEQEAEESPDKQSLDLIRESDKSRREYLEKKSNVRKSTRMSMAPKHDISLHHEEEADDQLESVASNDSVDKAMNVATSSSKKRRSLANETYGHVSHGSFDSTSEFGESDIEVAKKKELRKSTRMSKIPDISIHESEKRKIPVSKLTSPKSRDSFGNKAEVTVTSKKRELTANESYDISGRSLDLTMASDKSHREAMEKKSNLRKSTRMSMVPDIGISLYHEQEVEESSEKQLLDLIRESDKSHREATGKKKNVRKSTRMSMVPDISLHHEEEAEESPDRQSLELIRESDKSHIEATGKTKNVRKSTRMSMVPGIDISLHKMEAEKSSDNKQSSSSESDVNNDSIFANKMKKSTLQSTKIVSFANISDRSIDSTSESAQSDSETESRILRKSATRSIVNEPSSLPKSDANNDTVSDSLAKAGPSSLTKDVISVESRRSFSIFDSAARNQSAQRSVVRTSHNGSAAEQNMSRKETDGTTKIIDKNANLNVSANKSIDPPISHGSQSNKTSLVEFLKRLQEKKRSPVSVKSIVPKDISQSVKKIVKRVPTAKNRSQNAKECVPPAYNKRIFATYAKHKCTKEAFKALDKTVSTFFSNMSKDFQFNLNNSGKQTLELRDVYKHMKRLKLVSSVDKFYRYARDFLPLEGWEELIPTKFRDGVVLPSNVDLE